jgi:hypothetical protein
MNFDEDISNYMLQHFITPNCKEAMGSDPIRALWECSCSGYTTPGMPTVEIDLKGNGEAR